jgi:hypothetical protein
MIALPTSKVSSVVFIEWNNQLGIDQIADVHNCTDTELGYFEIFNRSDVLTYVCKNYTTPENHGFGLFNCQTFTNLKISPYNPKGISICTGTYSSPGNANITYYARMNKMNKTKIHDPIEYELYTYPLPTVYKFVTINYYANLLNNDVGLVFENIFKYFYFSGDILNSSIFKSNTHSYLTLNFVNNNIINKSFQKLQEQLISIFYPVKVIYLFFFVLNAVVSDYFYSRYILKIYIDSNMPVLYKKYLEELAKQKLGKII